MKLLDVVSPLAGLARSGKLGMLSPLAMMIKGGGGDPGQAAQQAGERMGAASASNSLPQGSVPGPLGSLKKGGPIHKTGKYELHKGERVLTRAQNQRFTKGRASKGRSCSR